MNKVELLFAKKGINRSGIVLYSKKDTLNFIEQCEIFDICILGIDAFLISENLTQPSLEDSIDLSTIKSNKNSYKEALQFIERRNDNLYFEIICE